MYFAAGLRRFGPAVLRYCCCKKEEEDYLQKPRSSKKRGDAEGLREYAIYK